MKGENRVMGFRDEEEQDDFFDSVAAMADRLQLKGQKRTNYIEDHMQAAGYERVQTREAYARVQQEGGDQGESGSSRWFGGSGRAAGSRRGSDEEDRF